MDGVAHPPRGHLGPLEITGAVASVEEWTIGLRQLELGPAEREMLRLVAEAQDLIHRAWPG